jgi:two-component system, OmpR family, sensor histidine kinase KdpD
MIERDWYKAEARRLRTLRSLVAEAAGHRLWNGRLGEREALRRSDAMKTAILRAVSHDLRSPLTAILASATALMRADLSFDHHDRRELLGTIVEEAERLERLVTNLLDLSRLQAGAADPAQSIRPIDDILFQTLAAMGVKARIEISLPKAELPSVRVDAHQIERVLSNLLENAIRHSPPSENVRVRVREKRSEILVRVIDHGRGIAENERERIFEPFYRGAHSQNGRGAGLGLAIARGFAEANGGRLWVESLEGQGTAFVLALPRAGSSPVAAARLGGPLMGG